MRASPEGPSADGLIWGLQRRLLVLLFPLGAGALALAFVIGCYAILTGTLMLALALRVRAWSRLNAARSSPPAGAV